MARSSAASNPGLLTTRFFSSPAPSTPAEPPRVTPKRFSVDCAITPDNLIFVDFDCAELTEGLASKPAMEAIAKKGCKTLVVTYCINTLIRRTPKKDGNFPRLRNSCCTTSTTHGGRNEFKLEGGDYFVF